MPNHSILYSCNIAKQLISVSAFLLIPFFSVGQIEKVTIERIPPPPISFKKDIPNARVSGALPAMKLPFWDDFSFNATSAANIFYPNDTLWENSRRVWVNNSMGINPPSINVATFCLAGSSKRSCSSCSNGLRTNIYCRRPHHLCVPSM
jgi:hypothetical protein